jgi:hypothetical protein
MGAGAPQVHELLLAKTDALIDAVVYRLYGLMKEEINIMKASGS